MFARLWWKEARQMWPVWAFLSVIGVAIQSLLYVYRPDAVAPGEYAYVALVVTMMYLFLIAAAAFAGERENGTLWLLDAMAVGRLRVWSAKASFILSTTLALGVLLWISALFFGRYSSEWRNVGLVALVWGLTALGWGLLWSAILSNALHAAIVAMVSLSLTLLPLVDLQNGPPLQSVPILLALAALTTGASAWAFRAGGPPRHEPRRARPTAPAIPAPDRAARDRRPRRTWTSTVPRLLWETLRQVRAESWMLLGLAISSAVVPVLLGWSNRNPNETTPFTLVGMTILGLVTGVMAFNGENRGATHRFLLHHGARPGVVWAVKVGTWWAASLGLWAIAFAPTWLRLDRRFVASSPFNDLVTFLFWGVSGLTIAFAIGVVCGMAFRRGIMAGMVAFIATLALAFPLSVLAFAQVMFPWWWPFIAVGFLAVGWAWSGDWLHDRAGWRRWARLALYASAVPAIFAPIYIAGRVWSVPELSAKQSDTFFERSRVVAPVPEADNAAPLYLEAFQLIAQTPYGDPIVNGTPDWAPSLDGLDFFSFSETLPPELKTWLEALEPALAKVREGARRPYCRYIDLRTATELDRVAVEPPLKQLILPTAASARVRLDRGDLEGAWTEVETLVRLAHQYSYTSLWAGQFVDPIADGLVVRWAADPRQTVANLEKVARAWRGLPPGASAAERARVDAALFRNLLDLPREEMIDKIHYGSAKKMSLVMQLQSNVQTTPWEVARARRAFDLVAAARIQKFETTPHPLPVATQVNLAERWRWADSMVDPDWHFRAIDGERSIALSPGELNTIFLTTPLLRYSSLGRDSFWRVRDEMNRRATWLVLLLRLHQARHGGRLPSSLNELLARPGQTDGVFATSDDLIDPYSGKPFGYVASHGQILLPIGTTDPITSWTSGSGDWRLKPIEGSWLLYSVGPDGVDDRADRSVGRDQKGDFVFPLKDGVNPPTAGPG